MTRSHNFQTLLKFSVQSARDLPINIFEDISERMSIDDQYSPSSDVVICISNGWMIIFRRMDYAIRVFLVIHSPVIACSAHKRRAYRDSTTDKKPLALFTHNQSACELPIDKANLITLDFDMTSDNCCVEHDIKMISR